MVIGVLQLDLRLHGPQSLKQKRSVIQKVLARCRNRFPASCAEVGHQDLWQRTEIGIAVVGNDKGGLNARLDHVINFVEDMETAEVLDHHIEFINL